MNPLLRIKDRLSETWSGLSDSERRLLSITAAAFVCAALILTSVFTKRSQSKLKEDIQKYERAISELELLGGAYRGAVAEEKEAERQLKSNKTSLLTVVSKAAATAGFELKDLDEKSEPLRDLDVEKKSVQIENVKKLDVDQLHKFLEEVEGKSNKGIIRIEKLHIKTRFDEPELLDIKSLETATWVEAGKDK